MLEPSPRQQRADPRFPDLTATDLKVRELRKLVRQCLARGVSFDEFYRDYVYEDGRRVFWNPFWTHRGLYTPQELHRTLRHIGYGEVPEAALNVFWQLQEQWLQAQGDRDTGQLTVSPVKAD